MIRNLIVIVILCVALIWLVSAAVYITLHRSTSHHITPSDIDGLIFHWPREFKPTYQSFDFDFPMYSHDVHDHDYVYKD